MPEELHGKKYAAVATDGPVAEGTDKYARSALNHHLGVSFFDFINGLRVAEVEALKDVSDTHKGAALSLSVATGTHCTDRLTVGANISAVWMDSKLATYSYGVRSNEATSALPAYSVKASVIPSIGLQANYVVTDHVSVVGSVQAQSLPKSVTRSPIIKRDTLVSAMVGVRYAFYGGAA